MRWPAKLSFAAAAVTAVIAVISFATVSAHLRRWVFFVAVPPIAGSVAQGVQYRRGRNANVFWPVAVYLFFGVYYLVAALELYVVGAILQTTAWQLGRRARVEDRPAPHPAADPAHPSA